MGELNLSRSTKGFTPPEGVRLIESINDLPFYRVSPGQCYVLTSTAMGDVLDELQKLWSLRESLAALTATKDSAG